MKRKWIEISTNNLGGLGFKEVKEVQILKERGHELNLYSHNPHQDRSDLLLYKCTKCGNTLFILDNKIFRTYPHTSQKELPYSCDEETIREIIQ